MTREEYENAIQRIRADVAKKTNEENLKALGGESLAWFLGNYSDGCRTCIYKDVEKCRDIEGKGSCIENRMKWLGRFTPDDKDDYFMFTASRENVVVGEYSADVERHNAEVDRFNAEVTKNADI